MFLLIGFDHSTMKKKIRHCPFNDLNFRIDVNQITLKQNEQQQLSFRKSFALNAIVSIVQFFFDSVRLLLFLFSLRYRSLDHRSLEKVDNKKGFQNFNDLNPND